MVAGPVNSPTAAAQAAVERAMAELRRGGIVVLRDKDGNGGLVIAASVHLLALLPDTSWGRYTEVPMLELDRVENDTWSLLTSKLV